MAGDSKEVARAHLADAGVEDLPDNWDVVTLGDLFTQDRGISVGVMYPGDHVPDGVPLIKAGDLNGSIINPNPDFRISKDKHHEYRRTALEGGELLMTLVGNVGQCAVVPPRMAGWNAARAVAVMRLAEPSDTHFVQQCLLSRPLQHLMDVWCNTTVQATLNLKEIRQLPLPWPPKKSRDAIAAFGKALDDKIELNRRMNATLEATARALFQSWFVDFDPVRAKLDGRQPAGMDKATAALFPAHLQDSPLGHIPKGWKVRTIEDVCSTVTRGVTPEYGEGTGRFIINQKVNRGSDLDWSSLKELSQVLEVPPERFAKRWDVLVNCLGEGTLGRTHLYKGESDIFAVDQHMSICRSEQPSGGAYIYQVLSGADGQAKIESLKTGSTGMTMFNISKLRTFELVWPPAEILANYFSTVEPLWLHIANNDNESRNLANLRDTLLPKLLSGAI